jgi:hypothetical protein
MMPKEITMRFQNSWLWIVIGVVVGLLNGCGATAPPDLNATSTRIAANILSTQTAAAPTVTPTPIPTHTPAPTNTLVSTYTPAPTNTPTPTPTPPPTDTPTSTSTLTPTPTIPPTNTPVPPTATPSPTPTPIDPTLQIIHQKILEAPLLGGDKGGLIIVNCSGNDIDWYIEEPREEYRMVAKIPAFYDGHCGVSHLEGLFTSVRYEFNFFAPGAGSKRVRYGNVPFGDTASTEYMGNVPAEHVGVVNFGRGGIEDWGTHADLKASLSPQ